jgi:hypothetical protein
MVNILMTAFNETSKEMAKRLSPLTTQIDASHLKEFCFSPSQLQLPANQSRHFEI